MNVTEEVAVAHVRRVLKQEQKAGTLLNLSRGQIIGKAAEKLGLLSKHGLDQFRVTLRTVIEDFLSEEGFQRDEDIEPPKKAAKAKADHPSPVKQKRKSSPVSEAEESPVRKKARPNNKPTKKSPEITSEYEDDSSGEPSKSVQPAKPAKSKAASPKKKPAPVDLDSDSDMSVLIDDPPPKRKSSKKNMKDSAPKRGGKSKETSTLSKNEETIKKLKSLVVACGVRKVWTKELAHCSTEAQQISHLRKMLSDLGLTRMSMEQAKSIRERRELQEEIADVVKFEKARGMSSSRTRAKADENAKGKTKKAATSDSEDDEEASVSPEPSPPKGKAKKGMHNPLAFLADQSSDED